MKKRHKKPEIKKRVNKRFLRWCISYAEPLQRVVFFLLIFNLLLLFFAYLSGTFEKDNSQELRKDKQLIKIKAANRPERFDELSGDIEGLSRAGEPAAPALNDLAANDEFSSANAENAPENGAKANTQKEPKTFVEGEPFRSIESPERLQIIENYFGFLPQTPDKSAFKPENHPVMRGVYALEGGNLAKLLENMQGTGANCVVIDAKESYGLTYDSQVPLAKELNACSQAVNFKKIVEECHARGVYVIARVVCFKDENMITGKPEYCICDESGEPLRFPAENNSSFASPYKKEVWDYLIDISKELASFGVDEIQFDYIRFPTGRGEGGVLPFFGADESRVPERWEVINMFLEYARCEIQDKLGIAVGADLFSIAMSSEADGRAIGQDWKSIGLTGIYSISPMIYPSHYANSAEGHYSGNGVGSYIGNAFFEKPDLEPYEVVLNALVDGEKGSKQEGYAMMRPYLQAFTANYLPPGFYTAYGAAEIKAQVEAVYDSGIQGWLLWDAACDYSREDLAAAAR